MTAPLLLVSMLSDLSRLTHLPSEQSFKEADDSINDTAKLVNAGAEKACFLLLKHVSYLISLGQVLSGIQPGVSPANEL